MSSNLFRGKSKGNDTLKDGEWVIGSAIVDPENSSYCIGSMMRTWSVDADTVGQYTGLTDETDAMIFEGDILGVRYGNETHYCSVKYDERTAQFVFDYGRRGVSKVEDLLSGVVFVVIGNIYDNPELLST